jgi:hypothetical protein
MVLDTNDADYIYGFQVFEDNDWEEIKSLTKKIIEKKGQISFSVLDNIEVPCTSYEDWIAAYEEFSITEEEVSVLKKFFGSKYGKDSISFGAFDLPHEYNDYDEDEDDIDGGDESDQ